MARAQPISQVRIDRRLTAAALLLLAVGCIAGCRAPAAGVLTLAPAGMHTTGACSAQPDGTLIMAVGGSAEATAYVDAGPVTITVTVAAASLRPARIEVWLAATTAGTAVLESSQPQALTFHTRARASGPASLRLTYGTEWADRGESAPTIHVEKIVVTQP